MDASRLGFDPLIPWLVLWGLVGIAVVLWGVYVALRGKAWLFRALAMTVLAIALANPQWIQEQREPLKDIVAVVMDRSESMNFRGRTETAQAAYDAIRKEIEADDTLELRIAETDPGADGTDMYIALQSALSDAPRERIAGVMLMVLPARMARLDAMQERWLQTASVQLALALDRMTHERDLGGLLHGASPRNHLFSG